MKLTYLASYSFYSVEFGAGIAGSLVSGAIGGAGFGTPLGHTAVGKRAFGVIAGVAGNFVQQVAEQLLDKKAGIEIDTYEVFSAGALGLISASIPTKIDSYVGKGFSGKTYINC